MIFSAVPLALALYLSFTDWNPIRGPFWNAHLNGLHNYETFLQDRRYWHAVWNTIYYAVGSVALVNVLSIPLAMLLNQKLRGINIYRTIAYLPAIMPGVAAVLIFRLIFQPSSGILSWFLTKIHVQCDPTQVTCNPFDWLSNPKLTMPAVIMLSAWGFGQTMLIYLAGLQGIDASYYEAASIDGASSLGQIPQHHPATAHSRHLLQCRHRAHRRLSGIHQVRDLLRRRERLHRRAERFAVDAYSPTSGKRGTKTISWGWRSLWPSDCSCSSASSRS